MSSSLTSAPSPIALGNRNLNTLQVSGGTDLVRFFTAGTIENEAGPLKMPGFSMARLDSIHTPIRGEFVRQCDKLDGLVDGVMNNYLACRAIFDMSQGDPRRNPWAAKRCPDNVDSNPADTTANACLTDGQISTLEFVGLDELQAHAVGSTS